MFVGVDCGGTAAKAAVYADDGTCRGVASRRLRTIGDQPRWAERDMDQMWRDVAWCVRTALERSGLAGSDIAAVGLCGHSDGLYPVDARSRPVRNAVLATDSRSIEIVDEWRRRGILDAILAMAGQQPAEPSQAGVFAWLCRWEPGAAGRIRWMLTAKDWLRLRLTGEVGSDFSEANASFGTLDGSGFDARIPELLGIPQATRLLPPLAPATDIAGAVTGEAARETGLRAGTPVAYGAHDIVAAALGSGIAAARCYGIVSGTWGVNTVLADDRVVDRRWQSRRWVSGQGWLHMSASPASTSNLDWFLRQAQLGDTDLDVVNRQVMSLLDAPVDILFFPFLFGSPEGSAPSAAFLGIRGWHTRADMMRAVFEGVIFNHLVQLDALRERFGPLPLRLTGGGSRSPAWGQLLADAADAIVEVPTVPETGCWGAAICAAVGIGRYSSVSEANLATTGPARRYEPRAHRHAALMEGYGRYQAVLRGLQDMWPLLTPTGTSAVAGMSAGAGALDVTGDPRDAG